MTKRLRDATVLEAFCFALMTDVFEIEHRHELREENRCDRTFNSFTIPAV